MEAKIVITKQFPCNNKTHFLIFSLAILVFISSTPRASAGANTYTSKKTYTYFIKTACNSTIYPKLCYKTLRSYASTVKTNPLQLCKTSLTLNLKTALAANSSVSKISNQLKMGRPEMGIVKDCLEEISGSIDELKEALGEMKNLGGPDAADHMANVKTWVSAALTDEDTCVDGFDGRKVSSSMKKKIKKVIVDLARMTSNTLALITSLRY